eukprot:scaffold124245_cov29-Tisochrysis_lutea.AAC.1
MSCLTAESAAPATPRPSTYGADARTSEPAKESVVSLSVGIFGRPNGEGDCVATPATGGGGSSSTVAASRKAAAVPRRRLFEPSWAARPSCPRVSSGSWPVSTSDLAERTIIGEEASTACLPAAKPSAASLPMTGAAVVAALLPMLTAPLATSAATLPICAATVPVRSRAASCSGVSFSPTVRPIASPVASSPERMIGAAASRPDWTTGAAACRPAPTPVASCAATTGPLSLSSRDALSSNGPAAALTERPSSGNALAASSAPSANCAARSRVAPSKIGPALSDSERPSSGRDRVRSPASSASRNPAAPKVLKVAVSPSGNAGGSEKTSAGRAAVCGRGMESSARAGG